jgi:hypothetical protein
VLQRDAGRCVERTANGGDLTEQVEHVRIAFHHGEDVVDVAARRLQPIDDVGLAFALKRLPKAIQGWIALHDDANV